MNKRGLQLVIKTEKVEVETRNASKSSSHYADTPCNPQCDQSYVGDTQTEKRTQFDTGLSYPP